MKPVKQTISKIPQTTNKTTLRTCKKGHEYYRSSDCPTCQTCEEAKRPKDGFLALLAAPAKRALENANIKTLKQLSKYSEKDILKLHGHNLDAFNDLLRGGFGVYEYEDPIKLIWTNFSNSRKHLGQTLIDKLVEIINYHDHIEFTTID